MDGYILGVDRSSSFGIHVETGYTHVPVGDCSVGESGSERGGLQLPATRRIPTRVLAAEGGVYGP